MEDNYSPEQTGAREEAERARVLAREKRKAMIQAEKEQGYLENLNRSPETLTPEEQFASLRKGDIGVTPEQKETGAAAGEEADGETTARRYHDEEFQAAKTTEKSTGLREKWRDTGRGAAGSQRNIRALDKEIKADQKQIRDLERALRPAQAVAFASQGADTVRIIKLWLKIVGASFVTVIGGIIMVLISLVVVPLLFVLGLSGVLPDSAKTRQIKSRANQLKQQIAAWQTKLANKNKLKQLEYQRLAQTRQ